MSPLLGLCSCYGSSRRSCVPARTLVSVVGCDVVGCEVGADAEVAGAVTPVPSFVGGVDLELDHHPRLDRDVLDGILAGQPEPPTRQHSWPGMRLLGPAKSGGEFGRGCAGVGEGAADVAEAACVVVAAEDEPGRGQEGAGDAADDSVGSVAGAVLAPPSQSCVVGVFGPKSRSASASLGVARRK
jgi:hypothetical protein